MTGKSASDKPILSNVLTNLKNFHASNKFKQAVLTMMTSSLSEDEVAALKKTFREIDENGDGTITVAEFKKAMAKYNCYPLFKCYFCFFQIVLATLVAH